jgi:hypothetical protein
MAGLDPAIRGRREAENADFRLKSEPLPSGNVRSVALSSENGYTARGIGCLIL